MRKTIGLLQESVNGRSLADACLSGDKNDLSLAPQSAGETDVKFSKGGLATDDSLCVGAWERGCTFVAHRSDELVSPSGQGLNEFRFVVPVSQPLANFRDVFLDDFR